MAAANVNIQELKDILTAKKISIPLREMEKFMALIDNAEDFIPSIHQQATFVQLLHTYEHSKKKVIILLEELGEKKVPVTISLAVLAEDWRGMTNSIAGLIHKKEGNILFMKALTMPYEERMVAIVLLSFVLETNEEYNRFLAEKNSLILSIREASLGSRSQILMLEDETVKFELYNQTVNRIKKVYKQPDIHEIIGESGEALKFFSSHSREYLEERKISDLAEIIIDNYRFQQMVRQNQAAKKIKIKNFETIYEKLTGITFVCWKDHFSVEHFLKTLEFIVPGHIIKHHKSFVNQNGLLIYRIEIVDGEENPLNPEMIKSIENSLDRQIASVVDETFSQIKTIGGFEHYSRAIIPFLMEELQHTNLTQVFLSTDRKNEFVIDMKLLIVAFKSVKSHLNTLVRRLEKQEGVEIYSVIPPRVYKSHIEVNILNFKVSISEFTSITNIFSEIKKILKKSYGQIRDFDEGLRERDMKNLGELKEKLISIQPQLLREIYYNFDEIYRIETPVPILAEIIRLGCQTIKIAGQYPTGSLILTYKKILDPLLNKYTKTVFILSSPKAKKLLSTFIQYFQTTQIYFTRFEWRQRVYLILTLKKGNMSLSDEEIGEILSYIRTKHPRYLIIEDSSAGEADTC